MITQDEALAELRDLNRQLGLPEDDGVPTPMSQADAMAELAQLDEELATLPMTFEEFAEKEQKDQARPLTEKAIAFGSNLVEGAKDLARQGGEALEETPWWMFNPIGQGFAYETMGDIINVGARDFTRFAKTLGAAVMDDPDKAALFGPVVYGASKLVPEEGKLERAYKRYKDNFNYNVKVRPAMLESGEIEYPKLVSFSANFVDPFMALPVLKGVAQAAKLGMKSGQKGIAKSMLDAVETAGNIGAYPSAMALRKGMKGSAYAAGLGLKGVGQVGKLTEKVAGAPRRIASKVAEKIVPGGRGAVIGGQVVGAITGSIPMAAELGIAEGIGLIAKKAGMEMGEILTTLGQPASQKRFLYRLSTNQAVSPTTRKLANYAYAMNGTAGGDALFNMVANGISAGAINAGLAGLSGLSAEEAGMAGGAGFLAGGLVPVGQAGSKAGKSNIARDALSIDRHIKNKLTEDQRASFKKLPEAAQLMLATLQESGIGAPKFMVMEPKAYLEMLNAERKEKGQTPLDRAPAGHYEKQDRTIYVNSANISKSAKVATEIAAHEVGHDFVYQSLGNDPAMLRLLLEKYEATPEDGTPFYFDYDADNNPVGDPVYLNDEAVTIASDYDRKQRGIGVGRDASKLAQEIGADQFAMMFSEDPNAFENFHPRLRRTVIDASRKLLSVLGVTEPMTGNPLSNPISKAQLNNPAIKRIFTNYGKARATELDLKGDLSEQSVVIEPKKGQTGEDRYVELFGGQGLSLRDAKNLVISNKGLVKEILAIKQRVKEEPKDTWYISKTGRLVGKDLNSPTGQEIYKLFTRNDPFGNVRNLLDAIQEGVSQRIGVRFGYRSGTKGKYQNPFKIRDYAVYGFEVSPLSNRNSRPTLKVLGYDQAIVRHNIQVLAENKFIKNINDFMKDFEEQGQRALEDPEGRINPEGRKENELMTAAFGLKESAPQIANPRLRKLIESKSIKKSFRGPDIEGMAGLTKGRDKALSFNYENIRDNYNPFRQASDQVFQPQQLQFDFSPPKAAQSLESKPNFWKIYRINPKGPKVYDEVADVLIQVGSPWMDGSIIESQAPLLGLEKGKLRQAMDRAHRRADRGGGKMFMPSPGDTTPSSVQSWDGPNPTFATKLTKGMAKDNKEIAALLRQTYEDTFGEPLKAQDFSDTEISWLADMLATEGEAALGRTGNAVDWYTSAVERALSVAEEIFPDIGKKFEAKDRFLGALSITSQNMRVLDNAKASVMQYEHKLRTGKFDYKTKHGAKADAITQNLKMYDQIEAKMGVDAFHKFLDRDFTVKTLSEWGKDFFKDKDFSIAGYQTDKVKGSAVFGPKIGQGFFQNLRGNYDPVTVDLWLRRTYGRLTGLALDTTLTPKDVGRIIYSVRKNVGKRKFAGLELPEFLQGVRITGSLQKNGVANFKVSEKSFESLFGDNTIGRDNTEAIFEFAEKLNREWERNFSKAGNDVKKAKDAIRKAKKEGKGVVNLEKKLAKLEVEKGAIGKEKPQWAKAGSTVIDKLKPIDVPSNAERAVITKAFNEALDKLRAKGINLTPADLQATLWYPEKDIWAYLKGKDSNALNMSYDTAMEMIRDQRK